MRIKLKNAFKSLGMWLLTLHLGLLLASIMEDIFILSGLGFIIWATFLLSKIAGIYILGATLVIIGLYLARYPTRKE
jgi:hypothetical protein